MNLTEKGFTLIELLVIVLIIGVICQTWSENHGPDLFTTTGFHVKNRCKEVGIE